MIDPLIHVVLFLTVVLVIIVVHGFFYTTDDRKALASVPWRFARFVFWCAIVAGGMILAQHTVASIH